MRISGAARQLTTLVCALVAACARPTPTRATTGGGDTPAEKGRTYRWPFDQAAASSSPADFIDVLGDWKVEAEASAPSAPNVLRQRGRFKGPDFPRVIVEDLTFADLTVSVRCRPEAGSVDQACGVMFRLEDSDNYYITRANALEGNVRLYRVVKGSRQQLATADLPVAAGEWHTLSAAARGSSLTVSWNGKPLLSATDTTFARGKIGLWTKADSITAFDDLEAIAQ